ncbi:hypothetical protein GCM10027580_20380 [Corynebacterium faecale]
MLNEAMNLQPSSENRIGLRIRVELKGTTPLVWRTIDIPSDIYLEQFHLILQGAMGWENINFHSFSGAPKLEKALVSEMEIALTGKQETEETLRSEHDVRVDQLLYHPGDHLLYAYDYDDGWEHAVVVVEQLPQPPEQPQVVDGEQACPPEKIGGPVRANQVAAWVRAGYDDSIPAAEQDLLREQVGDWSPDDFDLEDANEHLITMNHYYFRLNPELLRIRATLRPEAVGLFLTEFYHPIWRLPDSVPELLPAQIEPFTALLELIEGGVELATSQHVPADLENNWATRMGLSTRASGQRHPIAQVYEAAQDLGLIHVQDDMITPTPSARELGTDGKKWAEHLIATLPLRQDDFDRHAGFATLVTVGDGAPRATWYSRIQEYLIQMGWIATHIGPIRAYNKTLSFFELLINGPTGTRWDDQQLRQHERALAPISRAVVKG